MWLDRGELDKTIERSAQEAVAVPPAAPPPPYAPRPADDRYRDPRDHGKRRKKSFLSKLFD